MQITVSSGNQKVKLELPCSDAELNVTVRNIGLKDVVPYAKIQNISEKQSGLEHMVGQTVNLDELNYYVKRWESLVEYQKKKICACSESGEYKTLKDMINLTYNESGFYLIDDFKDMKAAGMRIFMDKYGGISEEEIEQQDFEKIAKETIEECNSVITPYGVLLNSEDAMEHIYNGKTFPEYIYDSNNTVLSIEIQNKEGEVDYLYLPTDIVSMEKLKQRLETKSFQECKIIDFNNIQLLEKIFDCVLQTNTLEELTALNEMCGNLVRFNEKDLKWFESIAEFTQLSRITELVALARGFQHFDVVEGVADLKEYGDYIINKSGMFEVDELIQPYIDYEAFARDKVKSLYKTSRFAADGFVACTKNMIDILSYNGELTQPLEITDGEYQILRLYNPLRGSLYEVNEYGDISMEATELSAKALVEYGNLIQEQVERETYPGDEARGLMRYYHDEGAVAKKVLDARPTVEEYMGELYGVLECRIREPLSDRELNKLMDFWSGQESDGWGENFEQRGIRVEEGYLNVHFWNSCNNSIMTEEALKGSMEEQLQEQQMQM